MFKKTLIAAALAVAATGSFAQVYVQGSIGQATLNDTCDSGSSCKFSSTGSKFLAGYPLGNGWAIEGQIVNYGKPTQTSGIDSAEFKINGWGVGAAHLGDINPNWDYRLGVALNQNKVDATGNINGKAVGLNTTSSQLHLSAGAGYKITKTLSLVGELDLSSAKLASSSSGVRLISIGLRASF